MLKGLGDIGNLMKLQKDFKAVQKKILKAAKEGVSNDGLVTAVVNGEYRLVDLKIDAALAGKGDPSLIGAGVISAVNDAVEKVKEHSAEEMGKLTGGLNIPGLSSFFK